jgi:catechol 2,3-dioxygenase-like lactoylglutathione lyase family enzyme
VSYRSCRITVQVDALWEEIVTTRFSVTFDCSDPDRLTSFWAAALGYQLKDPPAGFDDWLTYFRSIGVPEEELRGATAVYLVDPDGVGPQLFFQEVPEAKVVKNRVHLDLHVGGGPDVPLHIRRQRVNAEADRLVGAGATKLRVSDEVADHYFVVMQDPEGNEFCLN